MKKLSIRRSRIDGKGVFTEENIKKGEHIAFIKGVYVKRISKSKQDASKIPTWYGIKKDLWLDPGNNIWSFFNHSCEPSTAIIGTKKLIALRDIRKDTEITCDYSMTDGDELWEMKCSCESKSCRKNINSIQIISEHAFRRHLPFIPRYFVELRKKYLNSATI